jgi:hypothetical protein
MNRRDLLKLFSAGSAAVPLICGVPEMSGAARIVAPPQVELYTEMPASVDQIWCVSRERVFLSVDMTVKRTGQHVRFMADSFVIDFKIDQGMGWTMGGVAVESVPRFATFSQRIST